MLFRCSACSGGGVLKLFQFFASRGDIKIAFIFGGIGDACGAAVHLPGIEVEQQQRIALTRLMNNKVGGFVVLGGQPEAGLRRHRRIDFDIKHPVLHLNNGQFLPFCDIPVFSDSDIQIAGAHIGNLPAQGDLRLNEKREKGEQEEEFFCVHICVLILFESSTNSSHPSCSGLFSK